MAYSTYDDLLKQLSTVELAKLSGSLSPPDINYDRVDEAIRQSDNVIDSYLGDIVQLPLEDVPALINQISIEFTIANLYDFAYKNSTVPSTITWRKIESMKLLKDIKSGYLNLFDLSPPIIKNTIFRNKMSSDRIFNKNNLDKFSNF